MSGAHPYYESQGPCQGAGTIKTSIAHIAVVMASVNFAPRRAWGRTVRWRSQDSILKRSQNDRSAAGFQGIYSRSQRPTCEHVWL